MAKNHSINRIKHIQYWTVNNTELWSSQSSWYKSVLDLFKLLVLVGAFRHIDSCELSWNLVKLYISIMWSIAKYQGTSSDKQPG